MGKGFGGCESVMWQFGEGLNFYEFTLHKGRLLLVVKSAARWERYPEIRPTKAHFMIGGRVREFIPLTIAVRERPPKIILWPKAL